MNFEIPFFRRKSLKLEGIIDVQTVTTRSEIGITRSIVVSFEKYMKDIEWNEEKFDMQQFVEQWKQYLYTKSTWIDKVDDELKGHPDFHQALAMKVNEKLTSLLMKNRAKSK